MILDTETTGKTAVFVTHQGAICVDFAEIITSDLPNQAYFKQIREDFIDHPIEIPHFNQLITGALEIEPEALLARINDEQFEKLPADVKAACHAHPGFQMHHFLHDVAKGKQQEAQSLLNETPANTQNLLRSKSIFTDYSGRTFNCTAYEYAYWAKDIHMCRMLESYMDEETKEQIGTFITEIERFDVIKKQQTGLQYQQHGLTHCSAHFDLKPLKDALKDYVTHYEVLEKHGYENEIKKSWMKIGKLQRDVPAHVAQEYCRSDRSFSSIPDFKEAMLPRDLIFYSWLTCKQESWFPLGAFNSGFGFEFALMRGKTGTCATADVRMEDWAAELDLQAITHLDEARTANLQELRERLNPTTIAEYAGRSPSK